MTENTEQDKNIDSTSGVGAQRVVMSCALALALSACGGTVTGVETKAALELCSANGGLAHVSIYMESKFICENGAVFQSHQVLGDR